MKTTSHITRLTSYASTLRSLALWERAGVRGEKGFSLVELIIVIALIAIVAAIATPQFNEWLPGIRSKGAARELLSDMNLTKVRAISENRYHWIEFVPPSTYRIYADANGDKTLSTSTDTLVKTVRLTTGIVYGTIGTSIKHTDNVACCVPDDGVTFTSNVCNFMPSGRSGEDGAVYLLPEGDISAARKDRMMAVAMSPVTFKITAYRYNGTNWGVY